MGAQSAISNFDGYAHIGRSCSNVNKAANAQSLE